MAYDMIRYERGQVWMIRQKNSVKIGHEQDKDRPWLVLSIGKFNKSAGMITAVPITTRDSVATPAQVLFVNDKGHNNIIMCEQIKTFDYKSGNYILEYLGILSESVLEKVDVALSIHLGLHYSPITLNKLYDSMEAIVKSVGYMQTKADTPRFTDDDVLEFAEKLSTLASSYDTVAEEEVAATQDYDNVNDNKKEDIVKVDKEEEVETPKKRKCDTGTDRVRWTPENCRQFLKDMDTLSMKEVMDKWHIDKKSKVYKSKYYVQKLLEK